MEAAAAVKFQAADSDFRAHRSRSCKKHLDYETTADRGRFNGNFGGFFPTFLRRSLHLPNRMSHPVQLKHALWNISRNFSIFIAFACPSRKEHS